MLANRCYGNREQECVNPFDVGMTVAGYGGGDGVGGMTDAHRTCAVTMCVCVKVPEQKHEWRME